jgi:hypothetical protein
MFGNDDMKALEGKTVKSLTINSDKTTIGFVLDDGRTLWANAVGDCCSSSWFEHVEGIDALLGQKINKVVEREMPKPTGDRGDEVIQYYGWTLETNKGRLDLEMRNSSNGYYGGEVNVSDKVEDQYGQEEPIPETKPLVEDF